MTIGSIGQVGTLILGVSAVTERGSTAVVTPIPAVTGAEVFVGRDEEADRLHAELVRDGSAQVCVIEGMGGIGKTTLARQVAAHAVTRGWFAGGALFVDLHGYHPDQGQVSPDQVFAPLLHALGLPSADIPVNPGEQAARYHRELDELARADKRLLLVFDNASSTDQVRDLLPGQPAHRVMVTSRDTLAIPNATRVDLRILDESDARRLLRDTLATRWPDDPRFTDDADPAAEVRLVRACGYLPLAIVIAAAVLVDDLGLPIAELATDLNDSASTLRVLRHGDQGVQAALETSWRHLSAREPAATRLLSLTVLNPGPDIGDELAAALGDCGLALARAELRTLRQAHLIERIGQRWQLHDLVRLFVRQRAAAEVAPAELAAAVVRLTRYYSVGAKAADDHLRAVGNQAVPDRFADWRHALAWLDAERANLIALTLWAADQGEERYAVYLATHLAQFLEWRNHSADWVKLAEAGARAAVTLPEPEIRAAALAHLGNALVTADREEESIGIHQEAAKCFRDRNDHHNEAHVLNSLGMALWGLRRFEEAVTTYRQVAQTFRDCDDRRGEAAVLANLGRALQELNQFDEAVSVGEQALEIFRDIDDRRGEGRALLFLGRTLNKMNRFDNAINSLRDSVQIHRDTNDRRGEAAALGVLADTLFDVGRFDEGICVGEQALEIFRDTDERRGELMTMAGLGSALQAVGRSTEGNALLQQAADAFRERGDAVMAERVIEEMNSNPYLHRDPLPPGPESRE